MVLDRDIVSEKEMNLNRVFACLGGLAALVLVLFAYAECVYFLGFPDGHVTQLGAAERKLAGVFIVVSVPLSAHLLCLGWIATRRRVGRRLATAIVVYLLFLLGVAAVDAYCRSHMLGGGG